MRYTEVTFHKPFHDDYLDEIWMQGLADIGFESFMDDKAYIQSHLYDEEALRAYARTFIYTYACEAITFEALDCPDENWNATWEAEHPVEELPMGVRIVPHCAFGAGHHETTSMMVEALLALSPDCLEGAEVLDMGCGTGVLGIFAAKLGAKVLAVDIDDKSVVNTQENAALNGVSLDARLGSEVPAGRYDLILANIHRNILIAMMHDFAASLQPGGQLWLSGFYAEDVVPILQEAARYGLHLSAHHTKGDWQMLKLKKQ